MRLKLLDIKHLKGKTKKFIKSFNSIITTPIDIELLTKNRIKDICRSPQNSVTNQSFLKGNKNLKDLRPVISFVQNITANNKKIHPIQLSLDISQNELNDQALLGITQLGCKYPAQTNQKLKFTRLILYNNRLTSTCFINQNTIHLFDSIKQLNIEHNQLASIKGIQSIQTSQLQRLTLTNNSLSDHSTSVLQFMQLGQLRILQLQKNTLTSISFIYNKTLTRLLLLALSTFKLTQDQNKITCINFTSAKFLPTLYKLNLNSNLLKSSFIGVCKFQYLIELDLSKNQIVSAQGLTFLDLNQNLQKLRLSNNFITIPRFLAMLNCKLLTDLEMRQNFLVDVNCYSLRRCQLPRMNTICLTKNRTGVSLATEITIGLNKNNLVNLSLWAKSNLHHKMSSYPKMKTTFNKLAFYDY